MLVAACGIEELVRVEEVSGDGGAEQLAEAPAEAEGIATAEGSASSGAVEAPSPSEPGPGVPLGWWPAASAGFFDQLDTTSIADLDVGALGLASPQIDSDTGEFSDGGAGAAVPAAARFMRVPQAPGVMLSEYVRDLGVLVVRNFHLPAGITLRAVGELPLVIAATGRITIEGIVDVGADALTSDLYQRLGGPGGYHGSRPNNDSDTADGPGAGATVDNHAGSGAGYLNPGGDGHAGASPGGPRAWLDALFPLRGGAGGSVGAAGNTAHGSGGGGGGALYLVAAQQIVIGQVGDPHGSSGLYAPGGGSERVPGSGGRGSGGGAGGTLVIDAPEVTVFGTLAANGGGGSARGSHGCPPECLGERGHFGATPAGGGVAYDFDTSGELGGEGGTGDILPQAGSLRAGGGGSAGRIHLRGETVTVDGGALLSPSVAAGSVVELVAAP